MRDEGRTHLSHRFLRGDLVDDPFASEIDIEEVESLQNRAGISASFVEDSKASLLTMSRSNPK